MMKDFEVNRVREDVLRDDASRLSDRPGSHEFWNFFAFDLEGDLSVSMIFLSANMWDLRLRAGVHEWERNSGRIQPPHPSSHFLLQLNVTRGTEKIFTTVINPPGTTAAFSRLEPCGRIGDSSFAGKMADGIKTFSVHIDSPDMMNMLRLRADIEFRALSPGFSVDGSLFGGIPGAARHDWQWPIGCPSSTGNILITDRAGSNVFGKTFSGGGYLDHMWGEGLLSDVLDAWYFGRIDFGNGGALIYIWLVPKSGNVKPYGSVFRIVPGKLAVSHEIVEFIPSEKRTGAYGLEYYSELVFKLKGGIVKSRYGDAAVEDWPFQIGGPAFISVELPGDIVVTDMPGLGEYLWQPGIDSEAYSLMFNALNEMPWNY